jgi:hypothetical protein
MNLVRKIGRRVKAFAIGCAVLAILVATFPWAVVIGACVGFFTALAVMLQP